MTKLETNPAVPAQEPAPAPEQKSEGASPTAAPITLTQDALSKIIADAVASSRAEVMSDVAKILAASKGEAAGASPDVMSTMVSDLTMAIAGMTDTGHGRRLIEPQEAKRREVAYAKLGEKVMSIQKDASIQPHYELVSQTFLDGNFLEDQVQDGDRWRKNEIIWRGIPNAAMRPKNAIAKEIFAIYLEAIGGSTKNQSGYREQPNWVRAAGLKIIGGGRQMAEQTGLRDTEAEPATLSTMLPNNRELTSTDDRNATRIPILGTVMAPAERTAPGSVPAARFPYSN